MTATQTAAAGTAPAASTAVAASTAGASTVPLPLRHDTMFGVCEGLGEEFGFHPNWLRLGLVAPLFFWPALTIAGYFALGGVLALARWIVPSVPAPQAPVALPAAPVEEREPDDYRIAA